MTWADRLTALAFLAFWFGACMAGIHFYDKRQRAQHRREFVSRETLRRYQDLDNYEYDKERAS
jgi:hypothetical protein